MVEDQAVLLAYRLAGKEVGMTDIILTSYFTSKPDPQSGQFRPKNDQDLMRPWIRSLNACGLIGVICHDEPVMATGVTLQYYPLKTKWSVNDERFLCWLEVLEQHPEIERVFLTDLFDVNFLGNPFDLIDADHGLYCGCGAGFDRPISGNKWMVKKMILAYGRVYHPDNRTVNAGVIGGTRKSILDLLNFMVSDFNVIDSDKNINMAVFNRAVYDLFLPDRIMIGPPLTSMFKKYEQAGNFAIRHK
jgi:hypothetical protein